MKQGPVLVTGAGGRVAARVVDAVADDGYRVVGLDRPGVEPHPRCADWLEGDVADPDQVDRAVGAVGAVLHTAATFGKEDDPSVAFLVNVVGTYNLLDAARRHGGARFVLASEAAVHLPPVGEEPRWRSSSGDDHLYDLTKRLQEEVARDFSETFGANVVALRLGHVADGRAGSDFSGRPLAQLDYCRGGWVCCHDVAQACSAALRVEPQGFVAVSVVGADAGRQRFNVAETERILNIRLAEHFIAHG